MDNADKAIEVMRRVDKAFPERDRWEISVSVRDVNTPVEQCIELCIRRQ